LVEIMAALIEGPEDGKASGERIAKVIARSGLCSRRDAEVLIGEKRVSVNGAVIESAALDVTTSDKVLVDGKPLAVREPPRLWRYHKPKGRVTTHKDPEGRPTVFEALPVDLPRLISIGRLDFNTEGLLLLTNDGDLARHLELPSTGWARRYRIRAFGQIEQAKLDGLAQGLRTGGVNYGPIEASLEREQGDNVWITLSIREGKNREVRRIMEHLGLTVNRLIRVSFGPFSLSDLEPGQIEEVKTSVLKDQLGPRLTRQLGVKRQPLREDRKLAPGRSKPTYLRRKPGPVAAPERPTEERPMKRRRIFQEAGGEAPKVELVPEKRRRPAGPGRGGEVSGKPYHRSREDRPAREDRQYPPRRDNGDPIGRPGASEGRPERRPEREDRKYPPRRDSGERAIGKPGSASEGFSENRSREDRPERKDRKYLPRRDEGERRMGKPGSRSEGRPENREGTRRWSEKPQREARAGFERPPRPEKDRSARGEQPSFAERERPRWKSRPEQSEERGRSRFPRDEGKKEPRHFDSERSAERRGEPRQEGRTGKKFGTDAGRPKTFVKRFREDQAGSKTSRPSWRERKDGEKSGGDRDTGSRYGQRSEGPPRARKDEASRGPGKPRSFEKRSFKGPKREAPARGEGKPLNRRRGSAPRPRSSKPRPHTDKEPS
jgi:23S rRNA pseudouridine2605 synthase